jgi:hypothetical protein
MNNKKNELKHSLKSKSQIENDETENVYNFIVEKKLYLQEIIRNTIISIKLNRLREIFSDIDSNLSINMLNELYLNTKEMNKSKDNITKKEVENYIDKLQKIIDKLSLIISGFGTKKMEDLLYIVFGPDYRAIKCENKTIQHKYELIQKYIQPISYKTLTWKQGFVQKDDFSMIVCNKLSDSTVILEQSNTFECFDCDTSVKYIYQKINGIRLVIQNEKLKKTLIIHGIVENLPLDCFSNEFIETRIKEIRAMSFNYQSNEQYVINRMIDAMSLKDILIYGNEDFYKKMMGLFIEINAIKQAKLDTTIKKFLELEIMSKRNMLINMLIYNKDDNIKYICYLLYDMINANNNNGTDDEIYIYESLPLKLKKHFNDIVKYTIKDTNEMTQKYEINKITLEQQIYMMKVDESIREKAINKLKEVKGKTDEIGMKAKQYLEGLLKIPFGIYKEEKILKQAKENNKWFIRLIDMTFYFFPNIPINKKEIYTNIEISKIIYTIKEYVNANVLNIIKKTCEKGSVKQISGIVQTINAIIKQKKQAKIQLTNQTKQDHINNIFNFLENNKKDTLLILSVYDKIHQDNTLSLYRTIIEIDTLKTNVSSIGKSITNIVNILDESIYSHNHAKNQIMKIIGQWINGEQSGYCFGFEGSPGIGKTSLAKKGLSRCLVDDNGETRPFCFIALGGSSCAANLEGHGYTYANSTWGKIVDVLMEAKCMNPIIYVDELDKVSKTDSGKEIINIFMHLIDSTQNNTFQDKYFSGIDIDLSKILFIFSYNDASQIDRILLDRIHRIQFENLTLDDKMVIVHKYIIPEINKKMGFENIVNVSDDVIKFIIESYTAEPGVRKLKEIIFDLYGEINLDILKCTTEDEYEIPVKLTTEIIETKYLAKYQKIKNNSMHKNPEIGVINGLWANSMGMGGIIPIQTLFFPSSSFLELKLTGLQGDVMKESMNVAKTLAWNLTDNEVKKSLIQSFEETKCQGLHIHCPEGSISKDGPSAGAAITAAIYSLFNKKQIRNDVAMTGEISLNGEITEIGGLEVKINGGIRAGIKTILYPKANENDYDEWKKKNTTIADKHEINFIQITNINDAFDAVFL